MRPPTTRTIDIDVLGRRVRMTAPSDYIIPKSLERGGLAAHEPETIACALALCETREGSFIDIGANVGIFSIVVAAALGRHCHAFEPTPEMVEVIRSVAHQHDLPITVHELALSDYSGIASLYLSAKSDSSNSLNRRFRPHRDTIEVRVARLDESDIGDAAVLKLDTESTEPDILEGARHIVEARRPFIICEALPGRTEAGLDRFLAEHEYRAYHITPDLEGRPFGSIQPHGTQYYNWLFAPAAAGEEIWSRASDWRHRINSAAGTTNDFR
jgi:FkbM family methyltransferase